MVPVQSLIDLLLSQDGDQYIFGHEVDLSDTNPDAFDCSELIQWGCHQLDVQPVMPDGSWYQLRHCANHGLQVSVELGIATPGALLFRFSGDPFTGGRPSSAHVAMSLGDGTTIEARGSRYGVGQFPAHGRGWTHAALIPGINYEGGTVLTDAEIKVVQDLTAALESVESNGWFAKFLIPQYREWNKSGGPDSADLADLYDQLGSLRDRITELEKPLPTGTRFTAEVVE